MGNYTLTLNLLRGSLYQTVFEDFKSINEITADAIKEYKVDFTPYQIFY
jgi:hypothetical protein